MTEPIETQLLDLGEVSLADLRRLRLEQDKERIIRQVERPRLNLGTGPPGRAD